MAETSQMESTGAQRQAHAMLRAQGRCTALLRMPGPAASGDDSEQLGLAMPTFQDFPLGAVAFRKSADTSRLLVSAAALLGLLQTATYNSAEVVFETAYGVLIGDVLYSIAKITTAEAGGEPYCYILTLQDTAQ